MDVYDVLHYSNKIFSKSSHCPLSTDPMNTHPLYVASWPSESCTVVQRLVFFTFPKRILLILRMRFPYFPLRGLEQGGISDTRKENSWTSLELNPPDPQKAFSIRFEESGHKHVNKLASSVNAIAISEIWNYQSLTHWPADPLIGVLHLKNWCQRLFTESGYQLNANW